MSSSTRITLAILALLGIGIVAYYAMNSGSETTDAGDSVPSLVSPPVRQERPAPRSIDAHRPRNPSADTPSGASSPSRVSDPRPADSLPGSTISSIDSATSGGKGDPATIAPIDVTARQGSENRDGPAPASTPITTPSSTTPSGASNPPSSDAPAPSGPATPTPAQPTQRPTVVGPSPPAPQYETYTVVEGDNMWTIAQHWFGDGGKWDLIAKLNPLVDPQHLKIGQTLRMPPKTAKREDASSSPAPNSTGVRTYTVVSGDTLRRIAQRHYGDANKWEPIYEANRAVIGSDPHELQVGMKLTIPPAPASRPAADRR